MEFLWAQLLFHYTHTFSFIYYSLFIHYFVTFKQTNTHNVQHPTLIICCQESAVSPVCTHCIIFFYTLSIIILLVIFLVSVYFNAHNFRWKSARKCSYDPLRVRFSTQWIFKHTAWYQACHAIHFFLLKVLEFMARCNFLSKSPLF